MSKQTEWEQKAANLLKAELKRKGVTYAQLADLIGDKEVFGLFKGGDFLIR